MTFIFWTHFGMSSYSGKGSSSKFDSLSKPVSKAENGSEMLGRESGANGGAKFFIEHIIKSYFINKT